MRQPIALLLLVAALLAACSRPADPVDGLRRSRVDALNKQAFQNRYRDAAQAEQAARQALTYIDDSLPTYDDGRLRAWNNLATVFYLESKRDSVYKYIDTVLHYQGKVAANRANEQLLAHLLEARLRQRNSDMAGAFEILHEVEHSDALHHDEDGWLNSLAHSEFYITSTLLNYYNRMEAETATTDLLEEMEQWHPNLRCDFAEDMSFNYALAYGYTKRCHEPHDQSLHLQKALHYCRENLILLSDSSRYSAYHAGNTYIVLGFLFANSDIDEACWEENAALTGEVVEMAYQDSEIPLEECNDFSAYFFHHATELFAPLGDPYQKLGSLIAAARHQLVVGDTMMAQEYLFKALNDSTLVDISPKFEARLYQLLLVAGCAENQAETAQWTSRLVELLNYIKQNERADFALQMELAQVQRYNNIYVTSSIILLALALLLVIVLVLLRHRTRALQRETAQLQEANRRDIERIANVETCLSVLRHDITPFVSYLQNDKLPEPLRKEVTGQLLRTFENIKSWTNLSIPSGLQFHRQTVALGDLFGHVELSVNNFRSSALQLCFHPTALSVMGDALLLEILLRNLVNNAIQYTEQGRVDIAAEEYSDAHFVHISVSDTGRGMSDEEVDQLFRADKTLRTADTPQGYGTGFGLMLCRYIIKLHDDNTLRGCRIWCESAPAKGSTFHILLATK
ncbi:MAG: HAMP domain-containing histidine kinase [Bacteroidales bacterium]|nr:HAMP domain-containing histidine kinase [Bacteroidales bacterium]